jgi:hypothetical protein
MQDVTAVGMFHDYYPGHETRRMIADVLSKVIVFDGREWRFRDIADYLVEVRS